MNSGKDLDYNYLRAESKEYIPIKVKDGYGEILLESSPSESTTLQINEIKCDTIYTLDIENLNVLKDGTIK